MATNMRCRHKSSRDLVTLLVFVLFCLAVGSVGGAITATSVDTWYQSLRKPEFKPSDWIYAPVWTTIYVLIGVAAWRIWRLRLVNATGRSLAVFTVQLGLNLFWSFFFGVAENRFGIDRDRNSAHCITRQYQYVLAR